jgi:hypothetical protein
MKKEKGGLSMAMGNCLRHGSWKCGKDRTFPTFPQSPVESLFKRFNRDFLTLPKIKKGEIP